MKKLVIVLASFICITRPVVAGPSPQEVAERVCMLAAGICGKDRNSKDCYKAQEACLAAREKARRAK
mgnify:CR=1 FL=1